MHRTILAAGLLLATFVSGASAQTAPTSPCLEANPSVPLVNARIGQPDQLPDHDGAPYWFSRGEAVRVSVPRPAANAFDPGKDVIAVVLKWSGLKWSGEPSDAFVTVYPAVSLINEQLVADFVIPRDLAAAPETAKKAGIFRVPGIDLCMTAMAPAGGQSAPLFQVRRTLGITSHFHAALAALLAVAAVVALLTGVRIDGLTSRNPILRIIANADGTASLSQFQLLFWTLVVGGSATYVMALHGKLIDISDGTLTLLGISAASALGTQMKGTADAARNPQLHPQSVVTQPRWTDLVVTLGQIDVTRVQMIFFTVISALFVVLKVTASDSIPEIPANYLLLMGISNGVYFAAKFTTPNSGANPTQPGEPPP